MNVKEIKPKGLFNFFKGSTFEVTAAIEEKEQFLNAVQMAAMQQKKIENINLAADEKISIPLPAEKTVEPAPSYQRPVTPEKEVVVNKSESDIEKKLDAELKLPVGYHYTYGGQFENLKEAKSKLSVAVPIALVIILFLLFFTLRSMREVFIVFTEIPLAAIGGIMALWLRGMPFSISAGVGFIALFGVVVLNGIVLINQFDEFERHGISDINRRILNGCMLRLRPVLMTAMAMIIGMLPLALSEEQNAPLGRAVIGGLMLATVATLLFVPVVFSLVHGREKNRAAAGETSHVV